MPHPQSAQERGRLATVFGTLLFASFGLGLVPALGPPRVGGQSGLALGLEPIVTGGLRNPVYLTHAGDASGRLFVVEQPGRIRIVRNGRLLDRPFLDISGRVRPGGERGLLGLAFHPAYRRNGR
ncbi:MAG: PQQ-dependent sugar dehydrogenase, partial [Candidatus Methylomirabilia bacterium]